MPHPVVYFEIAGRDGGRLESFYRELFGWTIDRQEAGGLPYGAVDTGEPEAIKGGIRHEPEGRPEIVLYARVPDLDEAVERARSIGGSIRIPPMNFEGMRFALVSDPEGNPIGLLEERLAA